MGGPTWEGGEALGSGREEAYLGGSTCHHCSHSWKVFSSGRPGREGVHLGGSFWVLLSLWDFTCTTYHFTCLSALEASASACLSWEFCTSGTPACSGGLGGEGGAWDACWVCLGGHWEGMLQHLLPACLGLGYLPGVSCNRREGGVLWSAATTACYCHLEFSPAPPGGGGFYHSHHLSGRCTCHLWEEEDTCLPAWEVPAGILPGPGRFSACLHLPPGLLSFWVFLFSGFPACLPL